MKSGLCFLLAVLLIANTSFGQRGPPPGGRRPPPGGRRPPPGGRRPPPPGRFPPGGGRFPPGGGLPNPGSTQIGQNGGNPLSSSVVDSVLVETAKLKAQQGVCQNTGPGGPGVPGGQGGQGRPQRTRFGRQAGPPGRGQCGIVEGQCGKGLASVYHEELLNINGLQKRLVVTNGIPSHVYHDYSGTNRRQNPNEACRNPTYMVLPLNPQKGSFSESGLGPVGVASSGAFFYNHKDAQNQVAAVNEGETFDNCNGHADPMCRYHYHKAPICMQSSCSLVGYLLDGFPVYGLCDQNGRRLKSCYRLKSGATGRHTSDYTYQPGSDCDLDQANGYTFPGGNYGYIFTENYPFIMPGFVGTDITTMCSI